MVYQDQVQPTHETATTSSTEPFRFPKSPLEIQGLVLKHYCPEPFTVCEGHDIRISSQSTANPLLVCRQVYPEAKHALLSSRFGTWKGDLIWILLPGISRSLFESAITEIRYAGMWSIGHTFKDKLLFQEMKWRFPNLGNIWLGKQTADFAYRLENTVLFLLGLRDTQLSLLEILKGAHNKVIEDRAGKVCLWCLHIRDAIAPLKSILQGVSVNWQIGLRPSKADWSIWAGEDRVDIIEMIEDERYALDSVLMRKGLSDHGQMIFHRRSGQSPRD